MLALARDLHALPAHWSIPAALAVPAYLYRVAPEHRRQRRLCRRHGAGGADGRRPRFGSATSRLLLDHVGKRFQALVYVDDPAAVNRKTRFSLFWRRAPFRSTSCWCRPKAGDGGGLPVFGFEDYAGRFAER